MGWTEYSRDHYRHGLLLTMEILVRGMSLTRTGNGAADIAESQEARRARGTDPVMPGMMEKIENMVPQRNDLRLYVG